MAVRRREMREGSFPVRVAQVLLLVLPCSVLVLFGCASPNVEHAVDSGLVLEVSDIPLEEAEATVDAAALKAELGIVEELHDEFSHGDKSAPYQRYIMLHDTESEASPHSTIEYWANSGNLVAAHFVVGKDGTIFQCVPLDAIAHHAGYGDAGHNELYGVEDESRDDMLGSTPIGSWAPDYGMNSYSVGIELVHVGGSGDYPPAQLEALDKLIVYIDAYYGFESEIIDHKAWRSGNSDMSSEFAEHLASYQERRVHATQKGATS